jgi:hypothetical protein
MADHAGAGKFCKLIPLPVRLINLILSNISWNILGRIACLSLAALVCLILPGCGGKETPPPHAAAPPVQPAPPPVTPPVAEKEEPAEEPEEDPEAKKVAEAPKEEPKPEPPKRPTDLSKWKKGDYLAAKKENDRNLEAAIQTMAEKFQKDARAASLFKELLLTQHLPAEKRPDGTMGRPTDVAVTAPVADLLIKGLAMNQTPEATAILKELMYGKLDTPVSGRSAVTGVLTNMIKYLDYQEYEDYIFDLLTQPQKTLEGVVLVPESPITNDRLRTEILSMLNTTSTRRLNVRLAKYLEDPAVTKALATDLESMLIRETPDTLTAKLILYQNAQAEKRTTSAAENSMLSHSESAMAILLGIPLKLEEIPVAGTISRPTARQQGRSEAEVAAEMDFARQCWTPELETYLMQQIAKKGELTNSPGPLQLIGTNPTAKARLDMSELIAAHAYLGPASWTTAGMFGRATSDPSFVIQAKNVYHNPSRRAGRGTPDKETQDKWRDAMEPMIQGWFKRFYSAARNSTPEESSAAKETGNFKIAYHKDAHVVAEFHLVWPGTGQALIPEVPLAPLEIHYVRLEDNAVPEKIINHYKRYGATGPTAPKRTVRNGAWYDDLDNGATPKSKRSVDIYIAHKPIPDEKAPPGVVVEPKSVPISIDILTIEVPELTTK